MLSLESGNEVQEKMWIVFCKHTQSWWTFNYQPLSGTSWAGLQEKGKWQHGVWAPPRMSSAWKDVDCLQHTALSRTGMERCFCSCHRTEGLCAWCPFFLKHSLPLSGPLFSLPSLPPAAGALPIPTATSSQLLLVLPALIPLSLPTARWQQLPALSPLLGHHQLLPSPVMWWGPGPEGRSMATPYPPLRGAWAELSAARVETATMYFSHSCWMGWHPQIIHTLLFHTKGGTYASPKIKHLSALLILLHLFPSFVSGLIPHVPERCPCPFLADHLSKQPFTSSALPVSLGC